MAAEHDRTVRFGAFEVDLAGHVLYRRGRRVRLQEKSFRLLVLLLERPGEAITREQLQRELWPADTNVEFEDGLNHVVRRLREALDDSADAPRYIETLPRFGYRFVAPLEPGPRPAPVEAAGPAPVEAAGPAPVGTAGPPPVEADLERRPRDRRWQARASLGLLVTAVLVAAAIVAVRRPRPQRPAPVRSLAVLPFRSLSGTDEGERFAEGMTDALITDLARHGEVRVISRTSVLRYAGTRESAKKIGAEIGADAIVEATLQRSGDRLRLNVQLVDARDDRHLWAERYDRDVRDLLLLQDELASGIAARVLGVVEGRPVRAARSVRPQAYLAFMRARHFSERPGPENVEVAAKEYQRAIELDPGYAPPYAWRARFIVRRVHDNQLAPRAAFPEVERLARHALELDPELRDAEVALGAVRLYYDWDWAAAEEILARMARELPTDGEAQSFHSELLAATGRTREAVECMRAAVDHFPGLLGPRAALGLYLYLDRRYADALLEARAIESVEPRVGFPRMLVGFAQLEQGELASARAALDAVLPGAPDYAGVVGHARARAGDAAGARAVIAALQARSQTTWVAPVQFAIVHAALGERDAAFGWLEKALEERDHDLAFLKVWPMFDTLRDDPRFAALLRRMHLT